MVSGYTVTTLSDQPRHRIMEETIPLPAAPVVPAPLKPRPREQTRASDQSMREGLRRPQLYQPSESQMRLPMRSDVQPASYTEPSFDYFRP